MVPLRGLDHVSVEIDYLHEVADPVLVASSHTKRSPSRRCHSGFIVKLDARQCAVS